MKGLLIKDAILLKNQGKTLILSLVVIAAFLGIIGQSGGLFIVAYITIIISMFTVTTVSYDEFDNGGMFLMTLPVTRNTYVWEKYIFGISTSVAAWCVGMVAGTAVSLMEGMEESPAEYLAECSVNILIAWIFLSVLLPLRLKYDVEKARYVNMIVVGAGLAIAFLISRMVPYLPENVRIRMAEEVNSIDNNEFLALAVCATLAILAVSFICSRRIMKNKEY